MTPVGTLTGVTGAPKFVDFQGTGGANSPKGPFFGGATFSFKLPEAPKHVTEAAMPGENAVGAVSGPTSWVDMVHRMALDVNKAQQTAGAKVRDVMAGGDTPVHEAMIAMQESSVRFTMLSEMRNKMIEAYQEIMRMQV